MPMLGLDRYKGVHIGNDPRNPFSVKHNTEELFIVRERERDRHEEHKLFKDRQEIWEKGIGTRSNRAGVIREINAIKPTGSGRKSTELVLYRRRESQDSNKNKINIFE